jgi:hypothetical protein
VPATGEAAQGLAAAAAMGLFGTGGLLVVMVDRRCGHEGSRAAFGEGADSPVGRKLFSEGVTLVIPRQWRGMKGKSLKSSVR